MQLLIEVVMALLGCKQMQRMAQGRVACVRLRALFAVLLTCLCAATHTYAWQGVVTHVSDGDTVWVQPLHGGEAYKVRLQGIDAPEICQPWGPQARAALHAVLQGQVVEVQGHARDSYGRLLAQLSRQGQDVGAWMVGQGYAWSYSYQHHAGVYDALQAMAQSQRLGLFADARALQPRWFRKRFGSCHTP
jgi:micrococcal nuclease